MKRSRFLKLVSGAAALPAVWPQVAGAASDAPSPGNPGQLRHSGMAASAGRASNCVLVPSETPGPFPLDLDENSFFFRQDITEGSPGVALRQRVRVIGASNCEPMANVRVNVWHCNRDGKYSGYGTETGLTYCRGYQFTDANGECEFLTIVPGWYPGRVTHVHFQVHVSTQYSAVSQWTWPHAAVVAAVAENPALYPEGPDPLTPEQDGVFADGYELQIADLQWDADQGEYTSLYEVAVEGAGTTGVGYEEMQTAAVMQLGTNRPNPVVDRTTIPFTLHQAGRVVLSVWTLEGRCAHREDLGTLPPGNHGMELDVAGLGLATASCVYQLECFSGGKRFTSARRMTAAGPR